jgi:hypothetical protein
MLQAERSLVSFPDEIIVFFFRFTQSFQPHYEPGIDSASKINEYQNLLGSKARPARKGDILTVICEPIV